MTATPVDVPNSSTPAQAQKAMPIPSVSDILEPLAKEPSPAPGVHGGPLGAAHGRHSVLGHLVLCMVGTPAGTPAGKGTLHAVRTC